MGMWNDTCKCIDEDWKALKARIQASITGITVNGTTHYQTDGTGICDLGDIKGTDDADEIFMNDGRSVETAVSEDESAIKQIVEVIPGLVQDVAPNAVDNGINIQVTDGNGTIDRMLIRADDSLSFDGLQIGISDATDGRITQAQADATDAGTKADDAQTDATDALTKADKAIISMNTQMTVEEDYNTMGVSIKTNAGTSKVVPVVGLSSEDFAYTQSGMDPVFSLSEAIKAKINGAISAIAANNVDTALEMNIDKADGSTATVPLFTAGENLTWDGTTLNASGGSGGATVTQIVGKTISELSDLMTDGDIAVFTGSNNYATLILNLPSNINITTGTYGASMKSASTVTTGIPYQFATNSGLYIKTPNAYIEIMALYPLTDMIGTYTASISVDGADAFSATVDFGETGIRVCPYVFMYSTYALRGHIPIPIMYEGARFTYNCYANANYTNVKLNGFIIHNG